ncbi:MAG TPA: hypothetical protein PLK55_03315 [archaeon]|jgi:hypothetical protein|nr:hypothetical protein [archaeon]
MGTITISLDKKSENKLRDCATIMYGTRKDALSKTIVTAIDKLEEDNVKKRDILTECLDNPIKVKGKMPKTRAELYDRKIFD